MQSKKNAQPKLQRKTQAVKKSMFNNIYAEI